MAPRSIVFFLLALVLLQPEVVVAGRRSAPTFGTRGVQQTRSVAFLGPAQANAAGDIEQQQDPAQPNDPMSQDEMLAIKAAREHSATLIAADAGCLGFF